MSRQRRSSIGSIAAGLVLRGAGSLLSFKAIAIALVVALVGAVAAAAVSGMALLGGVQTQASQNIACAPGGAGVTTNVSGVEGGFEDYSPEAMKRAAIVLDTAANLGVGRQGQLIALITYMQESTMQDNKATWKPDSNHDAGGFQQRVLPGWYGTLEQVNDPVYGTTAFINGHDITYSGPSSAGPAGYHLPGLKDISGWESMTPGAAAQAVQISKFPDEYDKHVPQAERIMQHLSTAKVTKQDASDAGGAPANLNDASAIDCTGGGSGEYQGAKTMDQLPRFPMPAGCTDQTPLFSAYGPDTLNGHVPDTALCKLPGATDADGRLQARAVAAYIALNKDFKAKFGHDLAVTSTYRTFAKQQSTKAEKGFWAATPGWSNHGFGLAMDVSATPEEKAWLQKNGPRYGWWHPLWARPDGRKPENWHYEYGTWLVAPEYKGMDTSRVAY